MRREVTLEEISDGRLYEANDMVKADCQDCKGCFDCCTGMGDSVVLDPLDVWRLSQGLHLSVDQLLAGKIELGVTGKRQHIGSPVIFQGIPVKFFQDITPVCRHKDLPACQPASKL